jgi:hypothetical protein
MKNNYSLFILLILISGSISAQQIWDNFQDIRKNDYGFINGTFIPYFENPDKSGVNTSNVAGQIFLIIYQELSKLVLMFGARMLV